MTTDEKILALANDEAASEEERETALRLAHDLLTKYELDMVDVDQHSREVEDPRGHFMNDGWNAPYAKSIRQTISKLFRVKYYFGRKINGTRGEHHFVGRESAATTAMYMSDWIIKSVLREADRLYEHRLTPQGRSFCVGVSHRLHDRVEEMLTVKQQEITSAGYALVLYDVAKREEEANTAFIREMGTELTTTRRSHRSVRAGAYSDGQRYGSGISLNTQIGGLKKKELK